MAVWSEVLCSKIVDEQRNDADFYKPEYNSLEKRIGKIKSKNRLGELVFSIKKGIFDISPEKYKTDGVPLIRTYQIKSPIASEEKLVFISPNSHSEEFYRTELLPGDLVFTKIGAGIGDVSILPHRYSRYNFSQNVAGLSINRQQIDPYYLLCFLISKIGKDQILRYEMPSGQGKLELRDIKKIIVPRFNDYEIGIASFLRKSEEVSQISQLRYQQAQKFLEKELSLDKLKFKKPVGYEANFSQAMSSSRADAEHFYPEFDNICRHLPAHIKFISLSKTLVYCQRGKQPKYSENGIRVINSKHVLSNKINFEDNRFATVSPIDTFTINHGDVLMNGTGRGTIGRAAPYLETEPSLPDNHVTILRTRDIDPVYLSVFLNSKAGQLQVEKHQRGSSGQIELYPQDIRKFLIWEAPRSLQSEIRDLHDQASAFEKESKQFLE